MGLAIAAVEYGLSGHHGRGDGGAAPADMRRSEPPTPSPGLSHHRHWLDPERLKLATAAGPVPIALQLDKLGQTSEQSSDCLSLNVGQPLVQDGDGIQRLAIHMSQRQAPGIDDPLPTRDWFKSPWAREAALRHGFEDKLRRRWRSIRDGTS
jgi:hypothetical protein